MPGRDVEAVDDPRVVALELKQARPRAVRLKSHPLFLRREVDEPASPHRTFVNPHHSAEMSSEG
jgi:hypothetical protein